MDQTNILSMIYNTLQLVHVAGEDDLDRMLACIRAVKKLRDEAINGQNKETNA